MIEIRGTLYKQGDMRDGSQLFVLNIFSLPNGRTHAWEITAHPGIFSRGVIPKTHSAHQNVFHIAADILAKVCDEYGLKAGGDYITRGGF